MAMHCAGCMCPNIVCVCVCVISLVVKPLPQLQVIQAENRLPLVPHQRPPFVRHRETAAPARCPRRPRRCLCAAAAAPVSRGLAAGARLWRGGRGGCLWAGGGRGGVVAVAGMQRWG